MLPLIIKPAIASLSAPLVEQLVAGGMPRPQAMALWVPGGAEYVQLGAHAVLRAGDGRRRVRPARRLPHRSPRPAPRADLQHPALRAVGVRGRVRRPRSRSCWCCAAWCSSASASSSSPRWRGSPSCSTIRSSARRCSATRRRSRRSAASWSPSPTSPRRASPPSLPAIHGGHEAWRYTLISGVIPALPLILIRPFLPESPAWAAQARRRPARRPSIARAVQPRPGARRRSSRRSSSPRATASPSARSSSCRRSSARRTAATSRSSPRRGAARQQAIADADGEGPAGAARAAAAPGRRPTPPIRPSPRCRRGRRWAASPAAPSSRSSRSWAITPALAAAHLPDPGADLRAAALRLDLGEPRRRRTRCCGSRSASSSPGFFTVAQFSFWGNYIPLVFPLHLRGTGESFAANIGGRVIGTAAAWFTLTFSESRPPDPAKIAIVGAIVAGTYALVGAIADAVAAGASIRCRGQRRALRAAAPPGAAPVRRRIRHAGHRRRGRRVHLRGGRRHRGGLGVGVAAAAPQGALRPRARRRAVRRDGAGARRGAPASVHGLRRRADRRRAGGRVLLRLRVHPGLPALRDPRGVGGAVDPVRVSRRAVPARRQGRRRASRAASSRRRRRARRSTT